MSTRHRTARAGLVAALVVLASGAATVAVAQSAMPAGSPGRFTMHPTDNGVLRLDTQTGTMSICRQAQGAWTCSIMPDDRAAMADEIEKLKAENAELKGAVKRLEELAGLPGAQDQGKKSSGIQLPSEEDVDKAMSYVERMLKKFKDKLKELERDEPKKGTQL